MNATRVLQLRDAGHRAIELQENALQATDDARDAEQRADQLRVEMRAAEKAVAAATTRAAELRHAAADVLSSVVAGVVVLADAVSSLSPPSPADGLHVVAGDGLTGGEPPGPATGPYLPPVERFADLPGGDPVGAVRIVLSGPTLCERKPAGWERIEQPSAGGGYNPAYLHVQMRHAFEAGWHAARQHVGYPDGVNADERVDVEFEAWRVQR